MDIVVEEGNADVGNTAEPSYEVVAKSGCSAQLSTNDTDEHELAIESEDSKVSVGNAAKQSHDVVGVGIDCIFNHAKVSTEADLGPQPEQKRCFGTLIRISQHKKPKKSNVARVVSEDYKCTPEDVQLIEYIKTLPGKQVVVNIDSAWLNRNDMECLFHGDIELSGEALSAYIHCIRDEEHLLHREGGKVFLENTFISSLLKRDGDPKVLLNCKEDTIEKRVDNYLQSDMVDLKLISFLIYVFIPMNIENFHWYLAVLNAKKSEVHVLDSMGQQITDRRDLYTTLKGLERQIKLAAEHKELYQGKWSNLDVASWPVIEKITIQMQTDGVSCGLWMINYMEYWTGSSLSDNVTQDDITMFRFKLPAILWDSRLNTKKGHQNLDHNVDEDGESSSDVQIIDTPCELSKSSNTSHQIEPYISPYVLPAKVTSTNTQELMFVLWTYIMGIDNAKYLNLQKLKDILDVNKPMDTYCFNMAVRMIACNDALFLLEDKYHYMDLQFCILLPFSFMGHFTLYVLNMDTRSIYIMDSMPIPSWFKGDHPSMHYIHNIHYIANNMNAAMELANPTWKDDIYMWRRIVPTWVPRTLNWDLSGFLVINFMHDWNGIRLPCICTNGNDLRTKFLVELLKYKDNESKDNIPEEIQEIIRHIR
ncbi:hypothetical protein ZEAMMB73_Zm00001d054098 [Zea mays]|uniref:Ubiquitin-like protease family profile domain-containing protein n=1 Tax=Zea mays TaxID=4577 RepID=A0A1D6QVA8_MAIZE|nr:hypothetical protein ZEAMMB73_Zm00001d054098 [Zea mays]